MFYLIKMLTGIQTSDFTHILARIVIIKQITVPTVLGITALRQQRTADSGLVVSVTSETARGGNPKRKPLSCGSGAIRYQGIWHRQQPQAQSRIASGALRTERVSSFIIVSKRHYNNYYYLWHHRNTTVRTK